ncbi:hypothetical protein BDF14DRAFT_1794613 [Spinellus fusiger]|nr:hypothetical protein BDF14DRAFT_1794613 [Spinellus fusiger]
MQFSRYLLWVHSMVFMTTATIVTKRQALSSPSAQAVLSFQDDAVVTFLFIQNKDHVDYSVSIDLPVPGHVCLSWITGLPPLVNASSLQCHFPGSHSCISSFPSDRCQSEPFLIRSLFMSLCVYVWVCVVTTSFEATAHPQWIGSIKSKHSTLVPGQPNSLTGQTVLVVFTVSDPHLPATLYHSACARIEATSLQNASVTNDCAIAKSLYWWYLLPWVFVFFHLKG